jgi:hypothetical protein
VLPNPTCFGTKAPSSGSLSTTKFRMSNKYFRLKETCNRPGVAQRVPGGLGSQISWHSADEGGGVVSLTHRPPLPPGMFLALIFTRGWVDPRAMVRSLSLKNPVTPPGIDPGTVRLVAQRLNRHAIPGTLCFLYRALWYNYVILTNKMHFLNKCFNSSCLLRVSNIVCSSSGRQYCTCSLVWYVYHAEIKIKGYMK